MVKRQIIEKSCDCGLEYEGFNDDPEDRCENCIKHDEVIDQLRVEIKINELITTSRACLLKEYVILEKELKKYKRRAEHFDNIKCLWEFCKDNNANSPELFLEDLNDVCNREARGE